MSLEAALVENTAVMRELIAALTAAGAVQTAQTSAAAASSPAVKAVVKAQKEADAKKSAPAEVQTKEAETTASRSGEASTSAPETESATGELLPWADKTAELFAKLKAEDANFANVKEAVLGINRLINREQAEAVLARFGAQAITAKADKKGLDESQYPAVFKLCLDVLAGTADATASLE